MLRFERVSKIYPTGEVLKDITWEIKSGDRVGLVGVNGAGKSTQLRMIAGIEEPTDGKILFQGSPKIAYLQQEFDVDLSRTVRDELFQAFDEAADVLLELRAIENLLSSDKASQDSNFLQDLIKKLGILQSRFESLHGYELEAKVEKILPKIGFSQEAANQLVGDYSGGWQMRIALGKILLQEPDLLLLDEPTNHLDLDTIKWLEEYLIQQTVAIVVVSHDRQFLDAICNQIVSIERGVSRTYKGNYTIHLEQKEIELASQQSAFDRQQKELASQQEYIDRFRASATRSTQAKSREKLLQKIDIIESPIESKSKSNFYFPPAPRSGTEVVTVKDLTHSYGDNILFLDAKLEVERGDRIAFLGPNGSGKSTLLKFIMGMEKPEDGFARIGPHNVIARYFEQNQAEALDLNKLVIDTLFELVPDWTQTKARSLLGSFGLTNDSVFKEVALLSGGEKARLALALMMVDPCNLLLLDEPTNHLDIPAKEMLEKALRIYDGSILIVSHDRYFISRIASKIVEIREGELFLYRGDYNYYQEKKLEEKEMAIRQLEIAKRESKRLANRNRKKNKKSKK